MSPREPEERFTGRPDEQEVARLREAFAAGSGRPAPRSCPPAERIWEAVEPPEGSVDGNREVIDHVAACPDCAEEWRLALALRREEEAEAEDGARARGAERVARPRVLRFPAWAAAAAVALLALGVAGIVWLQAPAESPSPVYRAGGEAAGETIESLLPEGEPLPRSEPVLRWTPVPGGTTNDATRGTVYEVVVSGEDLLSRIAEASGLEEPRYRIPDDVLEDLPDGFQIHWNVEATTADGVRITSPTFITPIE
jgi:hypothetical protein